MEGFYAKQVALLSAILMLSFACAQEPQAQSLEKKFEAGAQFSLIQLTQQNDVCGFFSPLFIGQPGVRCFEGFGRDRHNVPGFGGRIGYNLSNYFALEAEGNFFPRDRVSEGGRKIQGLFGAKVGKRFHNFGLFAKARPGFVRLGKGDIKAVGDCRDPLEPCVFQPVSKTNLAFDLGGVAQWYPSKNTIVRFDVGDTIIRFGTRKHVGFDFDGPTEPRLVTTDPETRHNFQASVGVGFRF